MRKLGAYAILGSALLLLSFAGARSIEAGAVSQLRQVVNAQVVKGKALVLRETKDGEGRVVRRAWVIEQGSQDQLHGKCTEYFEDGRVKRESWYCTGKQHGPLVEYDLYGGVVVRSEWVDDVLHGLKESIHSGGQMFFRQSFRAGLKDGPFEMWHENGQLRGRGAYSKDKQTGRWETWFDTGAKQSEGEFNDGKKLKGWTEYSSEGKIVSVLAEDEK